MRNQLLVLFIVNGEKRRHHHDSFDLTVVISVIEEFVESVAGFLSLSYK